MTHLPFIAGAYALGVLIPAGFGLSAYLRLGAARRRLAAIDPRAKGSGAGPRSRSGTSPRVQPGAGPRVQQGPGPRAQPGTGPRERRGASA
jgi:hypothetical protein